jgi:regulator of RNase E activity RraA
MTMLSAELLALLRSVDTPTVCNALEHVMGGRTNEGFTAAPVIPLDPALPPIVGFARTARLRCSQASSEPPAVVRARRLEWYRYVSASPQPAIAVIQDEDPRRGLGAFWGEVNVALHKGLGVAGVLTDGSMRDLGTVDPGFQVLAGSVMPSHAFVHLAAIDVPVEVFGLAVKPGDLLHADRHGAVRIAPEHLAGLAEAIALVARKEAPLLAAARAAGFDVEALYRAWGEAEDVH